MIIDRPSFSILIPGSLVPSHPHTTLVESALESLRHLRSESRPPVVICHDPPKPGASKADVLRFDRYVRRLERMTTHRADVQVVVAPSWGHLAGNVRHGLGFISTEFVLILQHDFFFERDVDVDALISAMRRFPQIKHVRFNKRENVARALDATPPARIPFFSEVRFDDVSLCRTLAWSDNPHLCRTNYYEEAIFPLVGEQKTFPESVCDPIADEQHHELFGTFVWGAMGDARSVSYLDGRKMRVPSLATRSVLAVRRRLRVRSRARRAVAMLSGSGASGVDAQTPPAGP